MSLLRRYAGRTSSLSLYKPMGGNSSVKKLFLSAHRASLPPLEPFSKGNPAEKEETQETNTNNNKPQKRNEKKKSESENEPIADFDVPAAAAKSNKPDVVLKSAPPLPDVSASNFKEVLEQKMTILKTELRFSPNADTQAREVQKSTLNELLDFVQNGGWISMSDDCKSLLLSEVENNSMFREAGEVAPNLLFSDDLVVCTEPSWPHMLIIYQILQAIFTADPESKHFNEKYMKRVIARFKSPDANERTFLASFAIYVKNKREDLKDTILKSCLYSLVDYLDGVKSPHTLMPSLAVILNIFQENPPTDQEPTNVDLYLKYILPMFSALHYTSCHSQMQQIVNLFLKGAPQTCALPTSKALIMHFPLTKSSKTVNVLGILTSCLAKVPRRDFKELMKKVFVLYSRCTAGSQVKVSEASCSIWRKIELEPLIMDNAKYIFPIVYGILSPASKEAWSSDIGSCIEEVFEVLNRIDSFVFQELCRGKAHKNQPVQSGDNLKKWATVARAAARTDRHLNLATKLAEIQRTFAAQQPSYQAGIPSSAPPRQGVQGQGSDRQLAAKRLGGIPKSAY